MRKERNRWKEPNEKVVKIINTFLNALQTLSGNCTGIQIPVRLCNNLNAQ